jgi:hypothetical protein
MQGGARNRGECTAACGEKATDACDNRAAQKRSGKRRNLTMVTDTASKRHVRSRERESESRISGVVFGTVIQSERRAYYCPRLRPGRHVVISL